jgi:hypothetical protein
MPTLLFQWVAFFAVSFSAWGQPVPEHFENPEWDASKPPILDEAKPNDVYASKAWTRVLAAKPPRCGKQAIWRVSPESVIAATATKEKDVGVKGKFSRFSAFAHQKKESLEGAGSLDLSSWDSGLAPRDYRVMKYVFHVEEKGQSVLPFKFSVAKWTPAQTQWESTLRLQFRFKGISFDKNFPVKVSIENGKARVAMVAAERFTFLSAKGVAAFQKLLTLCNHHFLATFADIQLDLNLENTCPN